MSLLVRDLVEHLQAYPGETKLRLAVVCVDDTVASADDYEMRRAEDGSHELRISGALVRLVIPEPDQKP